MHLADWQAWWKRRGALELRRLLLDKWDPIGVQGVPEATDEYDGYIGPIVRHLREGSDATAIAVLLTSYRTQSMGLGLDPVGDHTAAAAIVSWYAAAMVDPAAT